MACSALVDNLEQPIRVEPLSKFPAGARPPGRPLRPLREPEGRQGLGSHRRHLRSRLRPARLPAAAGSQLPALELHLLHLLHGSLPAVQRGTPALSARPPSPRSSSSTTIPPARSSRRSACAPSPATAAFRSAASRRTASKSAPSRFRSPTPSPTSAATSSSRKPRTSCAAKAVVFQLGCEVVKKQEPGSQEIRALLSYPAVLFRNDAVILSDCSESKNLWLGAYSRPATPALHPRIESRNPALQQRREASQRHHRQLQSTASTASVTGCTAIGVSSTAGIT